MHPTVLLFNFLSLFVTMKIFLGMLLVLFFLLIMESILAVMYYLIFIRLISFYISSWINLETWPNNHFSLWGKLCAPRSEKWVACWLVQLLCVQTEGIPPAFHCSSVVPSNCELRWAEWAASSIAAAPYHILITVSSTLFDLSVYFSLLIALNFLFFTIID